MNDTSLEEFAYRRRDIDALLDALDEAVELVKECNHEYRVAENGRRQLQGQRDAAVTVLRDAREHPDYSDADLHLYMPDVIDDTLKALGAEETT